MGIWGFGVLALELRVAVKERKLGYHYGCVYIYIVIYGFPNRAT